MVTARSLLVLALAFGVAAAQEEEAPAADGESEEAAEEPVKCPIGGGFQELYAVAVLLSHQDKLAEAEVCLSDAITTTVPAYRMLSDIATVNSASLRPLAGTPAPATPLARWSSPGRADPVVHPCAQASSAARPPSRRSSRP